MKVRYWTFALMLVLVPVLSASGQGTPQDNLVHSYTFEEGPEDVVGGADGSLAGAAEIVNGALLLTDQEGAWLELPAAAIGINEFEEVTLEILFTPAPGATPDAGPNTGFTMLTYFGATTSGGLGSDYYFVSTARGDDVSRAAISIGNTSQPWSAETGANGEELDDNTMHHVVSTLTNESITLYVDGVLASSVDLSETNTISGISTDFAYLGRGGYVEDPSWLGAIHEFNIYDRALTAEEISALYGSATDVEQADELLPNGFALQQNYPNPFNPVTNIRYELGGTSKVTLAIYNVLGHRVATLFEGTQAAGAHQVSFDARDLPSGVYFYRLDTNAGHQVRTMMLLK